MAFSLQDALRWFQGGEQKKKAAFKNEKEAYDFCRNLYKTSGGVTPELRRAYEFYQKNYNDEPESDLRPPTSSDISSRVEG